MSANLAVLVRRPGPPAHVLHGFTAAQADKARLLIEDGGIVATAFPRVFLVVGSDGETLYRTHPDGCTCPAGLHARRCYHMAAAALLTMDHALASRYLPDPREQAREARNAARRHWARARKLEADALRYDESAEAHEAYARITGDGTWYAVAETQRSLAASYRRRAPRYRELAQAASAVSRRWTAFAREQVAA